MVMASTMFQGPRRTTTGAERPRLLAYLCEHEDNGGGLGLHYGGVYFLAEGVMPQCVLWIRAPWLDEPEDDAKLGRDGR
jgi:hypothetical protein